MRFFWERLAEMPYIEAEQELRARRLWAIDQRMQAMKAKDGDRVHALDLLLVRLNDELHMVCQAQNRANLRRVMREVLPPEWYEAVITRLAATDPRA